MIQDNFKSSGSKKGLLVMATAAVAITLGALVWYQQSSPIVEDATQLNYFPETFSSTVQNVRGKRPNTPRFLSTTDSNTLVDLYWSDDHSGRQIWQFTKVRGTADQYTIRVPRGKRINKTYLSVSSCGRELVDVYDRDDGSGRQRWQLHQVAEKTFTMRIVNGRHSCGKNLLSTNDSSALVDLYSHDDGSGRQHWYIPNFPAAAALRIQKITGYWILKGSNNHSQELSMTKSVSNSRGQTVGRSQTRDFSVTSTTTVEIGGDWLGGKFSQSLSVSAGVSNSVSRETSTQLVHSQEETCKATCDAPPAGQTMYVFQWATRASAPGGSLDMLTCHYRCKTNPSTPRNSPFG